MIGKRLQQLRKDRGYTRRELLDNLSFNYSTYANYESGLREPNAEILLTIAKFYNVSIDYIMGFTDRQNRIDDVSSITDAEYDHISMYRKLDVRGKEVVDSILESEIKRLSKQG